MEKMTKWTMKSGGAKRNELLNEIKQKNSHVFGTYCQSFSNIVLCLTCADIYDSAWLVLAAEETFTYNISANLTCKLPLV